ncbi:hypothetical protein FUSO5_09530, partial [Fusobacterium necrophorum BFTR-1]|uniref:AAA family ATPase n=1 Tax=Fusobacterium necrophorum TaxID=859 RepID=UPI000460E622
MFSLEAKKGLPNGISDFKVLREANYYYVDKTKWIEELQQEIGKTILFTRPRRFGKTLNMSMLQYFFDIQNQEENAKLFQGLEIEHSPYMVEQGKYPVVFLSFKDLKNKSWKDCLLKWKYQMKELYNKHLDIYDCLNRIDQKDFDRILSMEETANYEDSLKAFTKYLYYHYKRKVVILIDEYDTPIVSAYEHGYYEEA